MKPTRALTLTLLLVAALAAGCGGVDVDTDAIKKGFAEKAEAAYDDEDTSRDEDFNQGIRAPCFALNDAARAKISEALDLEGALEPKAGSLFGPPEQEMLACPMTSVDQDDGVRIGITVATVDVDVDVDGLVKRREDVSEDPAPITEGDADGLDDDDVIGFGDEDSTSVIYVHDGLLISVNGNDESLTPDQAFDLLPVVVEEVARVLTGP